MPRPFSRLRSVLLASTIPIVWVAPAYAQDMPSGGVVTAGSATIANGAATTTIHQTSDRAVIDWQRFSVGAGGQVVIDQPLATSALLNRVKGSEMSRIAGDLTANGQVFLINPNGIVIDRTGKVQARGGFVASTLDIGNDDFMAGKLDFRGGGVGGVANRGYITGGAVALLGSQVANEGVIVSPLGRVAIGVGKQATLDLNGDGLLQVAIPSDFAGADDTAFIRNTGLIDAAGGTVMLKVATAREIVRQTINMTGIIRATSVSQAGGTVLLDGGGGAVGIAGTIDASGQSGGRIDVTGGDVMLSGATLRATGLDRGGLIRVGGAFQGGAASPATDAALADSFTTRFGPVGALAAARTTNIDATSAIDASGGAAGGAVVVWSAERTRQLGKIDATGAIGGAIELSSKGVLTTDLSRVTPGRGGTLLLDPKNIYVNDAFQFGSGNIADPISGSGSVGYGDGPADATFNVADIKTLMDGGTDVFLRASNDINWFADLSVGFAADPGDLFLSAGRSVAIGGYLTLNQANLTVVANDTLANGVIDADRDAGQGGIDAFNAYISGATDSGGTGGNVRLTIGSGTGITNGLAGNMRLASIAARSIAIDAGAGTVQMFDFGGGINPASLSAADALTLNGALRVQASGGLTLSGRTVDWLNEASAALTATSPATEIRFVENGALTRYGVLSGGEGGGGTDTTRLALGKGAPGVDYTAIYGDAYGAFDALHLVSGTLRGGDTLDGLLAAGATSTTGPAAGQGVGDYAVTTSATSGFGLADGVSGYFIDLRAASDTLRITPKTLTATVTAGAYSYGMPSNVASLTGLVGSDSVGLAAAVIGLGAQALSGGAGGYAFAANLAAGQRSFTLTGLTGAASANYTLDLSGTIGAALAIDPRLLTYAGTSTNSTYGTLNAAAFNLSGVLFGDDVSVGVGGISRGGVTATLTATTGVGAYSTIASALTGSAAGNYVIDAANSRAGQAIIAPKALTYVTANSSSTYGTLATIAAPTLTGVLAGEDVGAAAVLNEGALTLGARAAGSYAINAALTGAGAGNYVLSGGGNSIGTLSIGRLAIGVTVADASQIYASPVSLANLTGVLAGDDVHAVGTLDNSFAGLIALANNGVGFDSPDVGTHAFQLTGIGGSAANNYVLDLSMQRMATLTVTPKPLNYTINSLASTYGSAIGALTLNIIDQPRFALDAPILVTNVATGVSVPLADIGRLGAGRYVLTAGALSGANAFNYMIAASGNVEGVLTVAPKAITYTGLSASGTYGGTVVSPGAVLNGAFFNDDVAGSVSILSGSTAISLGERTAAGSYAVAVTGLTGGAASNYVLTGGIDGLVTIAPKAITYRIGSVNPTYGQLATPDFTINGLLAGDNVVPDLWVGGAGGRALTNRLDAGSYVVSLNGLGGPAGGNYIIAPSGNVSGNLVVDRATLTYRVAAATSVYGDPLAYAPAIWSGLVLGDDAPITTVRISGSELVANLGAGTYTPDIAYTASSNYIVSRGDSSVGDYVVTRRPTTLTVVPGHGATGSRTYGILPGEVTGTAFFSNLVDSRGINATVTAQGITTSTGGFVNVGGYALTAGPISGDLAANYVVTAVNNGVFTVTPLSLSNIGFNALTSIYGTPPSLTTGAINPLAGDMVGLTGLRLTQNGSDVNLGPQTAVGSYAFFANALSGADRGNYSFDAARAIGSLTITPKALTYVTGNATSIYGTLATFGPATSLGGIVGSDQVQGIVSGPGLSATTGVGSYALTTVGLTGSAAANYVLTDTGSANGLLTINRKALTYTYLNSAPSSWVYGTTQDPAAFIRLNGLVGGDAVEVTRLAILTGTAAGNPLVLGSAAVLGGLLDAGSYRTALTGAHITTPQLTGDAARNYTLAADAATNAATSFTVTPRTIGAALTLPGTAVYGAAHALGVGFTGAVDGRTLDYALSTAGRAFGRATALPANLDVGAYTISLALAGMDAYNYALSGPVTGQIAITPKSVTVNQITGNVTYATTSGALFGIDGLLAGDDVAPLLSVGGGAGTRMTTLANGFGIGVVDRNVGYYTTSIAALAGADAGNYQLTGLDGGLLISPKTITYNSTGFAAQYGGLTLPICDSGCELTGRDNLLQMGAVTLNGILEADRGLLQPVTMLAPDGLYRALDYARDTPAGTYFQIVQGLTGSKASNYVLAREGNSLGLVFILPAWVRADAQDGGRLYTNIAKGKYITLGSPGAVRTTRSDYLTAAQGNNRFVGSDQVTVVVALTDLQGRPVDGNSILPIGNYRLRAVALTGAQAANYRLVPQDIRNPQSGSQPGIFSVEDSSVFGFSLLGGNPNAVYIAPSVVSAPAIGPITNATGSSYGSASAGLLSGSATGNASGSVNTGTNYADGSSMTASAAGAVGATASYGVTGLSATAAASGDVSIIVATGPVTINYGAFVDASSKIEVSFKDLTIGAGGEVMAGAQEAVTVAGDLGNGMSGSTGVDARVFTSASGETSMSLKNGATLGTSAFAGVGASVGVNGQLSGGGVTGSLATTIYTPGSLYIGAKVATDYEDQTLTLGFNLGVSLLIGGLEISPKVSFSTKEIENFGTGMNDMFTEMGTSNFWTGKESCDAGCRTAAKVAAENDLIKSTAALGGPTGASLDMIAYLKANPDVVALAESRTDYASFQIAYNMKKYGSIDTDLARVVADQQQLAAKLANDPNSMTLADVRWATTLRQQEQNLIRLISSVGGQVVVADGALTIAAKPSAITTANNGIVAGGLNP